MFSHCLPTPPSAHSVAVTPVVVDWVVDWDQLLIELDDGSTRVFPWPADAPCCNLRWRTLEQVKLEVQYARTLARDPSVTRGRMHLLLAEPAYKGR